MRKTRSDQGRTSPFLDVANPALDSPIGTRHIGSVGGMAPTDRTSGLEQFLRVIGVEGFNVRIRAGERTKGFLSVLTGALTAGNAGHPIRRQIQEHDGVFLATASLAECTLGEQSVSSALVSKHGRLVLKGDATTMVHLLP